MVQVPGVAEDRALLRVLGAPADAPSSEESSDRAASQLIVASRGTAGKIVNCVSLIIGRCSVCRMGRCRAVLGPLIR